MCVFMHVIFSLEFLIVPYRIRLLIYSLICPFNSSSYNILDTVLALNIPIVQHCLNSKTTSFSLSLVSNFFYVKVMNISFVNVTNIISFISDDISNCVTGLTVFLAATVLEHLCNWVIVVKTPGSIIFGCDCFP